jgi:hypothetical protein
LFKKVFSLTKLPACIPKKESEERCDPMKSRVEGNLEIVEDSRRNWDEKKRQQTRIEQEMKNRIV